MPETTVLDSFFDDIGSIASEPEPEAPPETGEVFIASEDVESGILENIGGSGAEGAEGDLMFIAAYAMEHGDVKSAGDFAVWLARELALAKRTAGPQPNPKYIPPRPEVSILADHLRANAAAADLSRSLSR